MEKMSKIDAEFLEKVVSGLTLNEAFSGKASKSKFSSPFVQHLFDYIDFKPKTELSTGISEFVKWYLEFYQK